MGSKRTPAADGGGAVDGTTTSIADTSRGDLKTLIHEHSLVFDQLVELIPARFFLPYSSDDKPWFPGLSKSEKKKFKAQTRENIIKSRRDRLDPTRPSSTLDVLKKSLAEEKESSDEEPEEEEEEDDVDDDDDDDDDEEEEEQEEHEEQEAGEGQKAQNKVTLTGEQPVTYEELQERLRRRIAELAAGRNTRPESRLKQERKKEIRNKKKLKVESKKNREKNKDKDATSGSNSGKRKREDGDDEIFSKNKKKNKVGEPTDITFGQVRIDGKDNNKKRKKKLPKEKELERAKRLEEVRKDPEKGKKVSWKAVVSKAAGEKVHDDPKLLKQSIKRDKKRQQKNAQKWKERELTVAKAKAEKQSKRTGNIRERIHQKKMRKIEKREKKLMRPGFEGRKEGYINE